MWYATCGTLQSRNRQSRNELVLLRRLELSAHNLAWSNKLRLRTHVKKNWWPSAAPTMKRDLAVS